MKRATLDTRFDTPPYLYVYSADELGKLLRQRRRELRIRQVDLAKICEISPRLLGEIEHGKSGVAIGKVIRVANAIGIDFVLRVRGKESI